MDEASRQATRVLAALAESVSQSMRLVRKFQPMPEVKKVRFDFDCYKTESFFEYGVGPPYVFNWYVDVALNNGNAIWWALDVQWDDDKWVIEARVELPGDYGPNTLERSPDRHAETVDEFVRQLDEATAGLVNSATLIETQF